ncbi:hypothetical protein AB1Y20_009053 [Prymnesium parvum]|uniref:Uncharacterized protein n=1 Tax=Prymnesium parvum TaxID=97485 RepID=A0AB34K386_PRYPA
MPILTCSDVSKAQCNCKKCTVYQRVPGGVVGGHVACHCNACRHRAMRNSFEGESTDFGTLVPDWCCNTKLTGPTTSFVSCGKLYCCGGACCVPFGGGMINYECKECKTFMMAHGLGAITGFSFVNATVMNRELPEEKKTKPLWHQYYNSGVRPFGEDPKGKAGTAVYFADTPSWAHIVAYMFGYAVPCGCNSNCCCCPPPK